MNNKQQSEGNIQLNLNGKSRNQSNGGYNAFIGERNADSMADAKLSEKFSITSVPRSTTNKTYSSLTNQLKENENVQPSTSRGFSNTGSASNIPAAYMRNQQTSSQNFRPSQPNQN